MKKKYSQRRKLMIMWEHRCPSQKRKRMIWRAHRLLISAAMKKFILYFANLVENIRLEAHKNGQRND